MRPPIRFAAISTLARLRVGEGWSQGFNFGPRAGVLEAARAKTGRACDAGSGHKVSLIGWSLGGVYARELAKELPHLVRGVITLGFPVLGAAQIDQRLAHL